MLASWTSDQRLVLCRAEGSAGGDLAGVVLYDPIEQVAQRHHVADGHGNSSTYHVLEHQVPIEHLAGLWPRMGERKVMATG